MSTSAWRTTETVRTSALIWSAHTVVPARPALCWAPTIILVTMWMSVKRFTTALTSASTRKERTNVLVRTALFSAMTNSTVTILTSASTHLVSRDIATTPSDHFTVSAAWVTSCQRMERVASISMNVLIIHTHVVINAWTLPAGKEKKVIEIDSRNDIELFLSSSPLRCSFNCSCPGGMELNDDSQTCQDIDECEFDSPCSHACENIERRFVMTKLDFSWKHFLHRFVPSPVSSANAPKDSFSTQTI